MKGDLVLKLEDLLIMEVPGKQLRHICSTYEIKPSGRTLEDYAKAITSDDTAYEDGEKLLEEFRFAGKTSVRIYKPIGFTSNKLNDINSFKEFLVGKYGPEILGKGLRIDPDSKPRLFKASEYKGKLYLSFTYLGSERRVFKNYEIVKERPQNVDYLVLHFNPFLLQTRVPIQKENLFKKAFLEVLGINEEIDWFNMFKLSNPEAKKLRSILNGGLTCARHKMPEGIYDSIEVRAKPDIDLAQESEYQESYSNKPFSSLTFEFPFRYNNGLEEDISIRITKDGINFYSTVSEQVIECVIENVLAVKADILNKMANVASEAIPN